jgi:amidohydrolase
MRFPLLLLALPALAQTPLSGQTNRDARIAKAVSQLHAKLVECRRDFHMNPELSNRETRTGREIADRLRALKLDEVRYPVARHGVVAVLKGAKPGPVVAWRADIDALPINETMEVPYKSKNSGVKHACGHDGHITVGLGLAELLAGMRQDIAGTILFIFQPAEEGPPGDEPGGAPLMLKEGAFAGPKPQAIFAYHVSGEFDAGTVAYTNGAFLASADTFQITFKGKKAHGSTPQLGNDAVVTAAQCIVALQTIHSRRIDTSQPSVLTIGTINGGDRHNIIADSVKVTGTVRTYSEPVREMIHTMMRQTLSGCTSAFGSDFDLHWSTNTYLPTINDAKSVAFARPTLERVLGQKNVIETKPVMGAEDFSYYLKEVPGAMFWLGVRNEKKGFTAGIHTAEFDIDEDALDIGVRSAAALILDYLDTKR